MAKGKRKAKAPAMTPEEAEAARIRVLRRPEDIEPGHWCSGIAPGRCPTCNMPDTRGATWHPEEWELEVVAEVIGVAFSTEAYLRGLAAAEAATGRTVTHEALLEREDEQLDFAEPLVPDAS